ncbi:MAG: 30S ribosomal protein S15 [Parcubacteria group bacterium]|nr:30S ribosomal protein S15 [Parcubacteria group bacterium]
MVLLPKEKQKVIAKFKLHTKDTGSASVQAALLTEEINRLASHLKKHAKDHHSRRGLLRMVMRRRRVLEAVRRESTRKYNVLVKKLGIKK